MRLGARTFDFDREVAVMGIVNRTPDSFYHSSPTLADAVQRALAQLSEGADIIDVGGVKAGPGEHVAPERERERVVPLITEIRRVSDVPLSVDTASPQVAAAALDAGADLVNDTSGLADPRLADEVAVRGAALVVMHPGGPPRRRPFRPVYTPDVTSVVIEHLGRVCREAQRRGVPGDRLVVDPGHDFGKNTLHSLELTRRLARVRSLGYPVLVALSRKDFLGEVLDLPVGQRLEASIAAAVSAVLFGARIVRVHDVAATVRAIRTVESILGWRLPAVAARGLE